MFEAVFLCIHMCDCIYVYMNTHITYRYEIHIALLAKQNIAETRVIFQYKKVH